MGFFAASLAAYLVYGKKESDAARTGFSLTMASAYLDILHPLAHIFNGRCSWLQHYHHLVDPHLQRVRGVRYARCAFFVGVFGTDRLPGNR